MYLFLMCRAIYAPMRVLRLADQKVAAMDKLHFFVCQANTTMPRFLKEAEHHSNNLVTPAMTAVLADKTDLASAKVDDDEDDDDSEEEEMEDDSDDEVEDAVSHLVTIAHEYIFIMMLLPGAE